MGERTLLVDSETASSSRPSAENEEVTGLRKIGPPRAHTKLSGRSTAMRELRQLVARVARTNAPALITGETGTGKEVVARALHQGSAYREGPFVALNCAAVPEMLLEAELFGFVKGAFTGAHTSRAGLFLQASGGTLFLDEIGDLPVQMQPKLLRALQARRVRPIGDAQERPFDCRIIAATNRDLESEVERGRFRRDLYYRINVLPITVPPLRARAADVIALAEAFLMEHGARRGANLELTTAAERRLLRHDWPGNVRELENVIEGASALATGRSIDAIDLRIDETTPQQHGGVSGLPGDFESLEALERSHIVRVLDATGGNKRDTARILKVDRSTLYRKLKRYGL